MKQFKRARAWRTTPAGQCGHHTCVTHHEEDVLLTVASYILFRFAQIPSKVMLREVESKAILK